MILLDVNIFVTAHRADADQHREIKGWLQSVLREPPGVAVSELALSGCLRIVTHPKVFKRPTPLLQAMDFLEDFRSGSRFIFWDLGRVTGNFYRPLPQGRRSRQSGVGRFSRGPSSLVANG